MKIPQEFPQFKEKKAVLIVTSNQEARFLLAENGVIEEFDSFEISKPHYSDREGFFMRRSGGKVLGSGSVYEQKKEKIKQDFFREFRKSIKKPFLKKADLIYLFCPGYLSNEIKENMDNLLKDKIEGSFRGNYFTEHPLRFLELIKKKTIKI